MSHVHSFPPVESANARVLVLGTMPSITSLREQQYYAHPQNLFWKLVGEILGFDLKAPYRVRTAALVSGHIALWDVLKSCTRASSLDSDIDPRTIVPNDIPSFLTTHPEVRRIFFNGAKAEILFKRHVLPALPEHPTLTRLPSTSPANASIPLAEKRRAWRAVVD